MSINTTEFARETLETIVQQWVNTTHPINVEQVDFTFLPDPHAENWMEQAILDGQRGFATLHLQSVFGLAVPLLATLRCGDMLCDQFVKAGRVRVLHVHDEPFGWTDGGDPDLDPQAADDFVEEWRNHPALDAIIERMSGHPDQGVEALDGDLRAVADQLLTGYRAIIPAEGGLLPDVLGAPSVNDAIQCLLPVAVRAKRRGNTGPLHGATWIAVSLTRGENLPNDVEAQELAEAIDKFIENPAGFGPAYNLRLLWASYFLERRTSEMRQLSLASSWRVLVDSARLIERLLVDPTIGSRTLVTLSGRERLRQQQAEAAAERARQEQAAREAHQARVAAGRVLLERVEGMPLEMNGLQLHNIPQLPDALKPVFRFAAAGFNDLLALGPNEWAGTTSSGQWLGIQRGPEPSFPYSYALMTGRDVLAPIEGVVGDNEFFHPKWWMGRGDFAYSLGRKELCEYDLQARTQRVLISYDPERSAVIRAEPVSYAVYPGGLCSSDRDATGGNLRFCAYVPSGELTTLECLPLPCAGVAYVEASGTLLILTAAHGLWVARMHDGAWHVLQRVAHVPEFTPFGADRLTMTVDGLHLRGRSSRYKVVNVDRERPERGVPLLELCRDLGRVEELPYDD